MDDFSSQIKSAQDHHNSLILKKVCESLILQLGGQCTRNRMLCDYNVFFLKRDVRVMQLPNKRFRDIHYRYITESFFNWIKLDEAEYEVNKK